MTPEQLPPPGNDRSRVDYETDTADHPFEPSRNQAFCAICGETRSFHPDQNTPEKVDG